MDAQPRTDIPLAEIRDNPSQPRHALGLTDAFLASIANHGVIVPVILYRNGTGYVIGDGHRRVHGARAVGRTRLAPHEYALREGDVPDPTVTSRLANAHRRELTPLEWADIFVADAETRTHAEIAETYGVSRGKVGQYIKLAWALVESARDAVHAGRLSFAHARQLGRLSDHDDPERDAELREHQRAVVARIEEADWNVPSRRIEAWVSAILNPPPEQSDVKPDPSTFSTLTLRRPAVVIGAMQPTPAPAISPDVIESIINDGDDPVVLYDAQSAVDHLSVALDKITSALSCREYGKTLSREITARVDRAERIACGLLEVIR